MFCWGGSSRCSAAPELIAAPALPYMTPEMWSWSNDDNCSFISQLFDWLSWKLFPLGPPYWELFLETQPTMALLILPVVA